MDSSHETLDNSELVVDDFSQWSKAVSSAGGIRDLGHEGHRVSGGCWHAREDFGTYDEVFRVIDVQVDATDVHGRIGRRSGDDDFLSTTLQVSARPDRGKVSIRKVNRT